MNSNEVNELLRPNQDSLRHQSNKTYYVAEVHRLCTSPYEQTCVHANITIFSPPNLSFHCIYFSSLAMVSFAFTNHWLYLAYITNMSGSAGSAQSKLYGLVYVQYIWSSISQCRDVYLSFHQDLGPASLHFPLRLACAPFGWVVVIVLLHIARMSKTCPNYRFLFSVKLAYFLDVLLK